MEEIKRMFEYIFSEKDSSDSGKCPEGKKERYRQNYCRQFPNKDEVRAHSFVPNSPINPETEWLETPHEYFFKLDLAGLKKHEVKLEIDDYNKVLCISRDFGAEREKITGHRSRLKRDKGTVYWRLVDTDNVRAEMDNGVLTVSVPKCVPMMKCEYRKHKARLVQIKSKNSGH
ncbi:18.1 kDa class I heat shock protein [Cucumis sativus]|uniref:SHSP domain-containing protein n=1 Tax=Cucumis sativus TaxID=3659 RepID=A0A0A0LAD4_CUCSA|nr:18.1 kDa class I heat shock protein [Cucumis sativus]KGN58818.1 hypothetical protein Csa_001366 [Cucumis sativus]